VFVYEAGPNGWTRSAAILGEDAGAGLGAAVAVDRDGRLIVGAPMQEGQKGQVIVYERDAETGDWAEAARLRPEGQVVHFGASLAVDGPAVWIGALGGAFAARFDAATDGGTWTEATRLAIERTPGTEFFATDVAVAGGIGMVGFPEDAFGAGSATVLARTDGGWQVAGQVIGESDAPPAITGGEVRCTDGDAGGYGCESVDLLSFVPVTDLGSAHGVHVNDIWGWTDPETRHEYALVGRADGTVFVDVTDPGNPVYVAELPRTDGSPVAVWRDIKTYGNYALVVADASGKHGMQIFDLTRLRDVRDVPATLTPDATFNGFGSAHNVIVNEESGFAYAVTGECGGGLYMVDLAEPLHPVGAGCYTNQGSTPLESSTHDSQCVDYVGPDVGYRGRDICFTSGFAGLTISDMSDRENPATLGVGKVPDSALPHQGWLTEDQRYFLLGDEGDEMQGIAQNTRTLIWDVTELDDPVLLNIINPFK
jgi:choice-of-anchor B domain-containing protein